MQMLRLCAANSRLSLEKLVQLSRTSAFAVCDEQGKSILYVVPSDSDDGNDFNQQIQEFESDRERIFGFLNRDKCVTTVELLSKLFSLDVPPDKDGDVAQ